MNPVYKEERDTPFSYNLFENGGKRAGAVLLTFFLGDIGGERKFIVIISMPKDKEKIVFSQEKDDLNKIGKITEREYGIQFAKKIPFETNPTDSLFKTLKIEFLTRLNLKIEEKALLLSEGLIVETYNSTRTISNSPFVETVLLRKEIELDDDEKESANNIYKEAYDQLKVEVDDVHGGKNNSEDKKHNIYTKVDLIMLYLLSEENRQSLHPKIKKTLFELEEKGIVEISLENIFFVNEKGSLQVEEHREIGIFLTSFFFTLLEDGNKILSLRKTPYDGDTPRLIELESPNFLFRRAFEIMCEMQEEHFKAQTKKMYFPYAFSEWGTSQNPVPRMLPITAQSLVSLRLDGDELECTACKEGSETFYGKGKLQGKLPRDKRGNFSGMCVKKLDALLEEAGILEEEKDKPWYVNFIGTWEQAKRRLDLFEKEMERLRLIGDKKYNFLNYYSKRFILYIDMAVKKLLDLSSGPSETVEEDTESWASKYLGEWGETLYKVFKKVFKVVGLMFYKFISLILQSPFMFEVMVKYIESYYDDICFKMAVKNTKQTFENGKLKAAKGGVDILRSKGSIVERFFYERGTWVELSPQEKEKKAKEESDAWYGAIQKQAKSLYSAMADYISLGKWKKTVDAAEFVSSEPFSSFLTALESVPVFGSIVSRIGKKKINAMIVSHVTVYGNDMISSIIQQNRNIDRLIRLFATFYYRAESCLNKGMVTIKDGYKFGDVFSAKLGTAFQHATFNVPYYAIIVLCEEARDKELKKNRSTAVIIEELIQSTLVGSTENNEVERKKLFLSEQRQQMLGEHEEAYRKLVNPYRKGTRIEDVIEAKKIGELNNVALKQDRDRIEKASADEAWKRKQWLIAAGAATITLGVLCAMNPPCAGSAVYLASAAASAAKGAAAYVFVNAQAAWNYIKDNIKDLESGIKVRVDRATKWIKKEGVAKVQAALDMAWKAGLYVSSKVTEMGVEKSAMVGTMIYKGGEQLQSWWENRKNANTKFFCLSDVLKQSRVNEISFRLRVKEYIERFRGSSDTVNGLTPKEVRQRYFAVQKLLLSKQSILVNWSTSADFLNLREVYEFFSTYAVAEATLA